MLLQGAMALAVIGIAAVPAAPLVAQSATAPHTAVSSLPDYQLEVGVTWDATLSNATTSSKFWMQGGTVEAQGRFCCGLGLVADVAGAHIMTINSSGVGLDMVTATFGPRYTWTLGRKRYGLFAQGLVGIVNGFNSVAVARRYENSSGVR